MKPKYKSIREMKEKDIEYYNGYVCGIFIGLLALVFFLINSILTIYFVEYSFIFNLLGYMFYGFISIEIFIWRIDKLLKQKNLEIIKNE